MSAVKQLSPWRTRFFAGHCPMSGANIQVCITSQTVSPNLLKKILEGFSKDFITLSTILIFMYGVLQPVQIMPT